MKKLLLVSALAVSLGGCASLQGTGSGAASFVKEVQAFTVTACGFRPALDAIGAVISAIYPLGIPVVGGVELVARAICAAPVAVAPNAPTNAFASASHTAHKKARVVPTPRGNIIVPSA